MISGSISNDPIPLVDGYQAFKKEVLDWNLLLLMETYLMDNLEI